MGCCFSQNRVSDINNNETPINQNFNIEPKQQKFQQNEIDEWLNLIDNLLNRTDLNNHAKSKKRKEFKSLEQVANYLNKFPNKLDQIWVIYVWISENISYDADGFKNGDYGRNDAEGVLESGKAVCSGYSTIFEELCKLIGIECITVNGYAKGFGYKIGQKFKETNHAWNSVRINEKWYYIESTWGSGTVDYNYQFKKNFNPYWFCTPPEIFVEKHFSYDFQLDQNIKTLEQFEENVTNDLNFYVYGFQNVKKFPSPKIDVSHNPVCIEFQCTKDCEILAHLIKENSNKNESILVQKDTSLKPNKHCLIVDLKDKNVNYELKIYAKKTNSNQNNFEYLTCYILNRKKDDFNFKSIPFYNLSFLNDGIKLLSHGSRLICFDDNPLKLEMSGAEIYDLIGHVKDDNDQKLDGLVLIQKSLDKSKFLIDVTVPNQGKYELTLFFNKGNEKNYNFLTSFNLVKNKPSKTSDIKSFLTLYNSNVYIEGPLDYNLVSNTQYEFRIRMKNAIQLALVDANNSWYYFDESNVDLYTLKAKVECKGVANVFAKVNANDNFKSVCSYNFK
ncbi:unnamed protein product [Brachionus calyciflorus]|uniref:Transglutaminase-like domain-containing protein n=1 Tax=Brachionus calyciflorus TaxID=104777 RepID=A0A814K5Y9_9BILA|nr:unnamed protein product [Brachionus calyciflorus]